MRLMWRTPQSDGATTDALVARSLLQRGKALIDRQVNVVDAAATPPVQAKDLTLAEEKSVAHDFQAQAIAQLDSAEQELQEIKHLLKSV